jgi:serine protease AprX
VLKAVGAAGAASVVPTAGATEGRTETLDSDFDSDGGAEGALIVFESMSLMEQLGALDIDHHAFEAFPVAYARLTAEQRERVADLVGVRRVAPNRKLDYHNDASRGATQVQRVRDELGYTGEGVHAVVIDSGIDGTHPDFEGRIRGNYRFVDPIDDETAWVDAGPNALTDDYGHGTHCSGTLAGDGAASGGTGAEGNFSGMAPDAELSVYSSGAAISVLQAVGAYNHVLENLEGVRLVSNSYGTSSGDDFDPDDPLNVATYAAFEQGILSVFSAGNAGEDNFGNRQFTRLNDYVKAPYVLGVAATDPSETVAGFSSRGRQRSEDPNYDRDLALQNFLELQEQGEPGPVATETYDTFSASGTTGGAAAVGLVQTTDTFRVVEQSDSDYDLTLDAHRIEATLTWEPSTPAGPEPNSLEFALEDENGNEVTSSGGSGFSTTSDNERRLAANVEPGTDQFSVTGWRGAAEYDLQADIQVAELESGPEPPFGIYRPGVGAPGVSVMSTFNPGHALQALSPDDRPFYGRISGTSMSCPCVAGICALTFDAYETESGESPNPYEVIQFAEATATLDPDDDHTVVNIGEGFVDALAAVELALEGADEEESEDGDEEKQEDENEDEDSDEPDEADEPDEDDEDDEDEADDEDDEDDEDADDADEPDEDDDDDDADDDGDEPDEDDVGLRSLLR